MRQITICLFALLMAASACKSNPDENHEKTAVTDDTQATPTGTETAASTEDKMDEPAKPGPVVGETSQKEIVVAHPEWGEIASEWKANADAVATLEGAGDVTIDVYLGTWCGDSRREVARWFATAGALESGPTVRYIAVDRSMQAGDVAIPDTLTNVPTFYVKRGDEALGRVVETAVENIEVDIADLVSGKRSGFISASVEAPAAD